MSRGGFRRDIADSVSSVIAGDRYSLAVKFISIDGINGIGYALVLVRSSVPALTIGIVITEE